MKVKKREIFILAVLVIITFVLRSWRVQEIPINITGDEVQFLVESVRINVGNGKGFFALCEPGAQPCFNDYLTAFSVNLFGYKNAPLGLRFPNILLSTLTIIPFYLILRKKLSTVATVLATILFTTSFWNLNFSRSAWNPTQLVFYLLMFIYLYERWFTQKKYIYLFLASLFSVLLYYGYWAGKYFLIILALFSLFQIVANRRNIQGIKKYIFSFAVVAFITFLLFFPHLKFILQNKEYFLLRPKVVSIFSIEDYQSYHGAKNMLDVLRYQTDKSISGIFFLGGVGNTDVENLRYIPGGSPFVDIITKFMVLAGLFIITFFYKSSLKYWIYASYFVNIFLISIPTAQPPNANRLILMLPIIFFLVGFTIDYLLRLHKKAAPIVITACLVIVLLNLNIYFSWAQSKELGLAREPALNYEDLDTWIRLQIPTSLQNKVETVRIEHDYLIQFRK